MGAGRRLSVAGMIDGGPTRTLGVYIPTGDDVRGRKANTVYILWYCFESLVNNTMLWSTQSNTKQRKPKERKREKTNNDLCDG